MKTKTRAIIVFALVQGFYSLRAQSTPMQEYKSVELGKIKGIKVSVLKEKDLTTNTTKNQLRVEYLPKKAYVSDMHFNLTDTLEMGALIKSLKDLSACKIDSSDKNHPDIVFKSTKGLEAHCYLTYSKAQTQAQASAAKGGVNQKFYVKTTDKMYEGKTVYQDANGSYIWKQSTASSSVTTAPASGPGITGTKQFSIQLEKQVGASKVILTDAEFKTLIELMENAKTKMRS